MGEWDKGGTKALDSDISYWRWDQDSTWSATDKKEVVKESLSSGYL